MIRPVSLMVIDTLASDLPFEPVPASGAGHSNSHWAGFSDVALSGITTGPLAAATKSINKDQQNNT
ncbi:MAG: hypothetical protein DRI97_03335 [Bacteroidetes bacterium]|nr:MAG: hypothetical protein DRI97_03335 [Bacteroidota bacterium]